MKVITNALVEQASGKLGTSVVFYRNAGRQCARIYFKPTNPQTDLQTLCRNAMSLASKSWSEDLSDGERTTWKQFAALVQERTGQLGLAYRRTGQQLYVASHQLSTLTNGSSSVYDLPINYSALPVASSITAVYDKSDGKLTINASYPAIPGTQELYMIPKIVTANTAAQTPTVAKSRMLMHATIPQVACISLERGGTLAPQVFSKTNYPALAAFDTTVVGYLYADVRAANSGIDAVTPQLIKVTIQD